MNIFELKNNACWLNIINIIINNAKKYLQFKTKLTDKLKKKIF